jgi:hypothetical protein
LNQSRNHIAGPRVSKVLSGFGALYFQPARSKWTFFLRAGVVIEMRSAARLPSPDDDRSAAIFAAC